MLSYIQNNPQETQRLVGVKYDQLEQLIKQANALHAEKQQELEARKIRIINKGGGRKIKLSNEAKVLNINIFKTYDNVSIIRYTVWSE